MVGWRKRCGVLAAVALLASGALACQPAAERAAQDAAGASRPASAAGAPAGAPPLETLRVAFAADAAVYAPWFIAMDKGYYAEEGLEIERINAGGGVATPALIGGDIQYSTSAASALSAALLGAPLRIVFTNADRTNYILWATAPETRSLQDLIGKTIGVQSLGDTMDIAARMALQQYNLDSSSVMYLPVGVGAQRLGAVEARSVTAVILSRADASQVQEAGLGGHVLVDVGKEVRMSWMGVATTERELSERPDRVKRFLRATIKGREYYKAFREESLAILNRHNEKPREINEIDYDDTVPIMTEDGTIPVDVQQRDAQVRATLNGVAQVPPVDQLYDYRIANEVYQELRASGWKPTR